MPYLSDPQYTQNRTPQRMTNIMITESRRFVKHFSLRLNENGIINSFQHLNLVIKPNPQKQNTGFCRHGTDFRPENLLQQAAENP